MKDVDLNRIRNLQLFAGISEPRFAEVTAGAFLQNFPANTTLLYEGDSVDFLYILIDGCVELQGTWNDKESTLAILRPISTFILAAVVLDANALMSARTLEKSQILMLSAETLRRTMQEDANFAVAVAQEVSGCYRGLVRTIKNQKLRNGAERLANYLLTLQVRQGGHETVVLPYEKRILASLLGMTAENLSRAFATLSDYGVEVTGAEVKITRPVPLKRLAKPSPLLDNHMLPGQGVTGKAAKEMWPPSDRSCSAERG
ncbi:MAG: transcriptional regulator [Asticcacaulis sp. 32-58-5]|nr:MAG: transcriptional regulator [Asticcacaulis sp. 32-58-5]